MYELTPEIIMSLSLSNGCFETCDKITDFLKPFLTFLNLSINITLKQFYDITKKDFWTQSISVVNNLIDELESTI